MKNGVRLVAVLVAAGAAAAGLRAQQSQTPVFRSGTERVEVDIVVTDRTGAAVRGLRRDDFKILEDGKPQEIAEFSFVDIPVPTHASTKALTPDGWSDVSTNRQPPDRRLYVLVLDGFNVDPTRSTVVRKQARQFIEENLGPNDLAAVIQLGRSTVNQQFTTNKTLLLAALTDFIGHKTQSATVNITRDAMLRPQNASEDFEEGARANDVLRMLEAIKQVCQSLGTVSGYRRSIVMFSEGIDFDTSDLIGEDKRPGAGGQGLVHESAKHAGLVLQAQQDLLVAARRANVAIYPVDPRGNTMGEDLQMQTASSVTLGVLGEVKRGQGVLRTVADQTGGLALVNTGDFKAGFAAIVQANSAYYVIGYSPANTARDGKYRRISVTINRPDVSVTARKGYFAPLAAAEALPPPAAPAPGAASRRMREVLASSLPVSGLDIRVAGGPVKMQGDKVIVALILEIDTKALPFAEQGGVLANDIEIAFVATDAGGKMQAGQRTVGNLRLPLAERGAIAGGLRYVTEFAASPGRYQVRMGAYETAGDTAGSTLIDIEVPNPAKAPLSIGTVVLTSSSAAAVSTTGNYPLLKSLLPGPPTAARAFSSRDSVVALATVSDPSAKRSDQVEISVTVRGSDDRETFRGMVTKSGGDLSSGGYAHVATIPLAGFVPGRYAMTIEARSSSGRSATKSLVFDVQ